VRVLVDAGLSARDLGRRLDACGVVPESIAFILLSHEHNDHTRGVERFSRIHGVPVACTGPTLAAMDLSPVHLARWIPVETGVIAEIESVLVDSFPVPHDAADPVGFVLESGDVRVGLATDLGHATTLVTERLRGCHVLVIEANHDPGMLREGPYPWHLKQRVGGRLGHLSNPETASLLRKVADDGCRAVVLAHLSEKNNTHALARTAASRALADAGNVRVEMRVARQRRPSAPVIVG